MIDDIKSWLRPRAGLVLCICTGLALALSLTSLVGTMGSTSQADADAQAQQLIEDLEADLATAQEELQAEHLDLLAQLPGMDIERVRRDQGQGRSLVLTFTGTSTSALPTQEIQQGLDGRYEFLDTSSRSLTEFIPEWKAATNGTSYVLGDLDITLQSVQSLDYSYVGLARLDPAKVEGESPTSKSEFVIFTYSTTSDGTVTSFEMYRASSSTRDALLAQDQPEPENEAAGTAEPSDGG